jgi:phosphohistidine swiveling domain-containing protein
MSKHLQPFLLEKNRTSSTTSHQKKIRNYLNKKQKRKVRRRKIKRITMMITITMAEDFLSHLSKISMVLSKEEGIQ